MSITKEELMDIINNTQEKEEEKEIKDEIKIGGRIISRKKFQKEMDKINLYDD